MVEVDVTGESGPISVLRKRTVGILDMGGGSAQIAFEVPHTVSFNKPGPEVILYLKTQFLLKA